MKRTIVIVDLVILACLAGFFIGRAVWHAAGTAPHPRGR